MIILTMSPSNNARVSCDENTKSSNGLIVPFPELHDKSRHLRTTNHGNSGHTNNAPTPSAPISFPKSHIHRTPSELQLEQSLLQAEYSDVMMYARLVRGMTERGAGLQAGTEPQQGHVLSRKSLMGVVESRQRTILEGRENDDEEDPLHSTLPSGGALNANVDQGGDGWSVGYSFEDVPTSNTQGASSGLASQRRLQVHSNPPSQDHRHHRELAASQPPAEEEEDDDECVFSLEM
jgi:hypothetical protein